MAENEQSQLSLFRDPELGLMQAAVDSELLAEIAVGYQGLETEQAERTTETIRDINEAALVRADAVLVDIGRALTGALSPEDTERLVAKLGWYEAVATNVPTDPTRISREQFRRRRVPSEDLADVYDRDILTVKRARRAAEAKHAMRGKGSDDRARADAAVSNLADNRNELVIKRLYRHLGGPLQELTTELASRQRAA